MRLVLPPRLQGFLWWAWHQADGTVQPSTVQVLCRRRRAVRCLALCRRTVRPRSRTSDLGAQHGRDDAALGGEAAGLAGGDRLAGVELGGLDAAEEGLELHGDHDGGVDAAGDGELVGGVALDVLAEGLAEQLRGRHWCTSPCSSVVLALEGVGALRGGDGVQRGLRASSAFSPGMANSPLHRRRGRRRRMVEEGLASRACLLLRELLGEVLVEAVGVDDLEQVLPEPLQVAGRRGGRPRRAGAPRLARRSRSSTKSGSASTASMITLAWSASIRPAASARPVAWKASSSRLARLTVRCRAHGGGGHRVRRTSAAVLVAGTAGARAVARRLRCRSRGCRRGRAACPSTPRSGPGAGTSSTIDSRVADTESSATATNEEPSATEQVVEDLVGATREPVHPVGRSRPPGSSAGAPRSP